MHVKGFVEQIGTVQVRGWAYSPERPDLHLEIAVACGDRTIGSGVANLHRSDLRKFGVGDGDHAFVINFDQAINESDLANVSVMVLNDVLSPTELKMLRPAQAADEKVAPRGSLGQNGAQNGLLNQQSPVFVLGAARSGTSAMAQTLLRCGLFEGFEEGHYLGLLPRLLNTCREYYKDNGEETLPDRSTLISRIPKTIVDESIKDLFRSTMRLVFPRGRWLDKTPTSNMASAAPLMQSVWPNARFIFMKRRALENILSRTRKFPQLGFEDHCRDWVNVMKTWREVRGILGAAAIEIEQAEMAREPDKVSAQVIAFLGMSPEPALLFAEALRVEQPERTSPKLGTAVSIETVDWTSHQQAIFREICGEEMKAYGYPL